MANVSLTFCAGTPARLGPLLDGRVRPEGIDLQASVKRPGEIFWEMPLSEPWDVSEMSLTGYLWAIQHGKRWIALPVFPGWVFSCHADTLVNVNAGIERAVDLRGKRVGVPEYAVTAIAWIRDAWRREADLRPSEFTWCEERTERSSHYRPMGYRPPAQVPLAMVPEPQALCDMLIAGQIDAVTRYFGGPLEDPAHPSPAAERSRMTMAELAEHPNVRWLYPDRKAAALASYHHFGWPQPIHCVIVRQEVVDQYPWVPSALYDAFVESARLTVDAPTFRTSFPFAVEEQRAVVDPSFAPVGLEGGTRKMLDRLLDLAVEDGFCPAGRFTVDELFHPSTVD